MKMLKPIVLGLLSLLFGVWLIDISTGWWMLVGLVFVLTGFVTPIIAFYRHTQNILYDLYGERRTVEFLTQRLAEESGETPMWWKQTIASAQGTEVETQPILDAVEDMIKNLGGDETDIERMKKPPE